MEKINVGAIFLRSGDELPESPLTHSAQTSITIPALLPDSSTPIELKPRVSTVPESLRNRLLSIEKSASFHDSPLKTAVKSIDWQSAAKPLATISNNPESSSSVAKKNRISASIKYDPHKGLLGEGRYSRVFRGTMVLDDDDDDDGNSVSSTKTTIPCAVKRLKDDLEEEDLSLIWSEISMLSSLQGIPNVIRLFTMVNSDIMNGPFLGEFPVSETVLQNLFLQPDHPTINNVLYHMDRLNISSDSTLINHHHLHHQQQQQQQQHHKHPWLIVTELAEKGDLMGLLRNRADLFTLDQIRQWTRHIVSGLAAIHSLGIIHHDIKPQNILICETQQHSATREFVAKITDFGNAAYLPTGQYLTDGLGRGTTAYTAPEIFSTAADRRYDHAADIYSLGVTIYCMLTGEEPFASTGSNSVSTIMAVKRGFWSYHRPPGHQGDAISLPSGEKIWNADEEPLVQTILSCTSRNPIDRPSASQILINK